MAVLSLGKCYNKYGEEIDDDFIFPPIPELVELLTEVNYRVPRAVVSYKEKNKQSYQKIAAVYY